MAALKEAWSLGLGHWKCLREVCGAEWHTRADKDPSKPPLCCPRCKSYNWRGTLSQTKKETKN